MRPGRTTKAGTEAANAYAGDGAGRIHLFAGRHEGEVHARGGQLREVFLLCPGVGIEILAGAELRRVDEDADHRAVTHGKRCIDQRHVASVQRTHGGHQSHRLSGSPPPGNRVTQVADGSRDFGR